jgi:HEAT repeat protein
MLNLVHLYVESAREKLSEGDICVDLIDVPESYLALGIKEGSVLSRKLAIETAVRCERSSDQIVEAIISAVHPEMHASSMTPDTTVEIREYAARALAQFSGREHVQHVLLRVSVGNDVPSVTRAACEALVKMGSPSIVQEAMGMLESGSPTKNIVGAYLLGKFQYSLALPIILVLIQRRPGISRPFINSLGDLGTKGAVDALLVYTTHRDWMRRESAVCALAGHLDRHDVRIAVEAALKDSRQAVRIAALEALAATQKPAYLSLVLSWFESESHTERQVAAKAALHYTAHDELLDRLLDMVQDPEQSSFEPALYALRYFPGECIAEALVEAYQKTAYQTHCNTVLESLRQHADGQDVSLQLIRKIRREHLSAQSD